MTALPNEIIMKVNQIFAKKNKNLNSNEPAETNRAILLWHSSPSAMVNFMGPSQR